MEIGFLRHEKILPELSLLLFYSGLKTVYFPLVNYCSVYFNISSKELQSYTGLILCSKRAVEVFLSNVPLDDIKNHTIYCVGERAKKKLFFHGLKKLHCYPSFLELSKSLTNHENLLYPASNRYSRLELEFAQKFCSKIKVLVCYEVIYEDKSVQFQDWLNSQQAKGIFVLAPSQAEVLRDYDLPNLDVFCMGKRTKSALEKLKIKNIHISNKPNMASLVESCCKYFKLIEC